MGRWRKGREAVVVVVGQKDHDNRFVGRFVEREEEGRHR